MGRVPCQQEQSLKHNHSLSRRKPPFVAGEGGPGSLHASIRSALATVFSAALLALAAWLPGAVPAAAQEDAQAGLVIVHGDGSLTTQCVTFAEESITGAELLVRGGIDVAMEASSMGATICRLAGEGCAYPQAPCFCRCEGTPCLYWSYWRLTGDRWTYSTLGASYSRVRAGDVDGWRWGEGAIDRAQAPPDVTFAAICDGQAGALAAESGEIVESDGEDVAKVAERIKDAEPSAAIAPAAARPLDDARRTPAPAPGVATQAGSDGDPVTMLAAVIGLAVALPLVALTIAVLRRDRRGNRA